MFCSNSRLQTTRLTSKLRRSSRCRARQPRTSLTPASRTSVPSRRFRSVWTASPKRPTAAFRRERHSVPTITCGKAFAVRYSNPRTSTRQRSLGASRQRVSTNQGLCTGLRISLSVLGAELWTGFAEAWLSRCHTGRRIVSLVWVAPRMSCRRLLPNWKILPHCEGTWERFSHGSLVGWWPDTSIYIDILIFALRHKSPKGHPKLGQTKHN